jgi:glyoxylase-like metal-dependent hydrolase (beta-lactamase superfamily II)
MQQNGVFVTSSAPWTHVTRVVDTLTTPTDAASFPLEGLVSMHYMSASHRRPVEQQPFETDITVAFVNNSTSGAVPHLMATLRDEGLTPAHVKFIIVTHVHLDHCAGTGTLLQLCPNAVVLCHPLSKRHLVDPSALMASARRVYPDEAEFRRQVGDMIPCDPKRVIAVSNGQTFFLSVARPLTFHFALGHAKHHVIIHDPATRSVFTGDACGTYPDGVAFGMRPNTMFPTTSPAKSESPPHHLG